MNRGNISNYGNHLIVINKDKKDYDEDHIVVEVP